MKQHLLVTVILAFLALVTVSRISEGFGECDYRPVKNIADPQAQKVVQDVLDHVRVKLRIFRAAIQKEFPNDERVKTLKKWNGHVLQGIREVEDRPTENGGGTMGTWYGGCMVLDILLIRNTMAKMGLGGNGLKERLKERALAIGFHELAHAFRSPHDDLFHKTNQFYQKFATEKLNFTVLVQCQFCDNLSTADACFNACPKCKWPNSSYPTSCYQNRK